MATQRHHRAGIILATTAALLASGAVPAHAATAAPKPVSHAQAASAAAHSAAVRKAALAHRRSVTRASFLRTAAANAAKAAAAAPAAPVVSVPPVTVPVPPVVPVVTTPAVSTSPSGVSLPKGDLPGWKQVVAEDFSGSSLPEGWGSYEGTPGGDPNGKWLPSHTSVGNGVLKLAGRQEGDKFVTGGIMAGGPSVGGLTYGKYEVRFRADKGHGVAYALLLWPKSEHWPVDGEIDFAEDGGGDRSGLTGTLHYGADNAQIQKDLTGDFSSWNTVGVEWTPSRIVYTLNGKAWATVTGSAVPHTAMNLGLQTQATTCGSWSGATCPDSSTPSRVDLQVDWVTEYAYTG